MYVYICTYVLSAIEEGYHGDYDLKSSARIESQLKEDSEDDGPAQPPQKDDPKHTCLLYTSPSPRDRQKSRMPSSA